MATTGDIITEARDWIGVPWRHQGRSRQGLDCIGLVIVVCGALDILHYKFTAYRRSPSQYALIERFYEHFDRVQESDIGEGGLVLMRENIYPCHAAWVANEKSIIHASWHHKCVTEERIEPYRDKITHYLKLKPCYNIR